MKAPRLDLNRANRADAAPGLVALIVGVAALLGALRYMDTLKSGAAALDEREAGIASQEQRRELISRAHRHPDNPRAAALMAQQKYATEPARDLIEGGWRPNIAFLTLDIATGAREINMTFETRSVQEALSYGDWLEAQPNTERVLIKRQTEKPGPPIKSAETMLQVIWRTPRQLAGTGGGASAAGAAGAASAPAAPAAAAAASGPAAGSASAGAPAPVAQHGAAAAGAP